MSGNEPDCDCAKCGCSLESDAYARGKADGMAEAEARIIAWVRGEANEGYNEIQIADALERGEHRK